MKDKDELDDLKKRRVGSSSQPSNKIADHSVSGGETLSHIAAKYYGSTSKAYWMLIYEANKALIGDDPNRLKRGITLEIPELPQELKK